MKDLTKEEAIKQLQELQNYIENIDKKPTIDDITSFEKALEILKNEKIDIFHQYEFVRNIDWVNYQLEIIVKAVNYIDNNYKLWYPDWNNKNESKYYPYFEYKNDGWCFGAVYVPHWGCVGSGSFAHFKNEKSIKTIVNRFINLYDYKLKNGF